MIIRKPKGELIKTPATLRKEAEEHRLNNLPNELVQARTDLEMGLAETVEHITTENISLKIALADSYEQNLLTKLELQLAMAEVIEMIEMKLNMEGGEV